MRQHAAVFHTFHKLIGFLHDGQIGSQSRYQTPYQSPVRRSAAAILPSTLVPMGIPNAFAQGQRGLAGAVWTITCLVRIGQSCPNTCSSIVFLRAEHRWDIRQCTGRRRHSWYSPSPHAQKQMPICVSKPRLLAPMTPMPCVSLHTAHAAAAQDTLAVVADHDGRLNHRFQNGVFAPS